LREKLNTEEKCFFFDKYFYNFSKMKTITLAALLCIAWMGEAGNGNLVIGNGNIVIGNNNFAKGD
jgi:hypothetical protein